MKSEARGQKEIENTIFNQLKADIVRLERFIPAHSTSMDAGLSFMKEAFPNRSFPLGAVHEFLCGSPEGAAATSGFVSGIIASIMKSKGTGMWISASRTLFPPALRTLGIHPEHFIFVDLKNDKEVLWVMDEALKCAALTTVVGELRDLDFTQSRRLQLAVEQSHTTGFVLRKSTRTVGTTACVSRWRISSIPSDASNDMPGIGYPGWNVELLRMRSGRPGTWQMHWRSGSFHLAERHTVVADVVQHQIAG